MDNEKKVLEGEILEDSIEAEIENNIESAIENTIEGFAENFGKIFGERIGDAFTIFFNLLYLWFAHNVTSWDITFFDFIKDAEYQGILWMINISVFANVVLYSINLIINNAILRRVFKILENCISFAMMVVLIRVFPFDFTKITDIEWINSVVLFAFYVSLFGITLGSILELKKLLLPNREDHKC